MPERKYEMTTVVDRVLLEAAKEDLIKLNLEDMLRTLTRQIREEEQVILDPRYQVEMRWMMPNPDFDSSLNEPSYISVDEDEEWTEVRLRVSTVIG